MAPVRAQSLDQLRADADAKVARAQAVSAMMGRSPSDGSALLGLDVQDIVFRGQLEGKPITPEAGAKLQRLALWAQGVMEEALLTPEVPLQEMLQEPMVGVDEMSAMNLGTHRVMTVAKEISRHRPDAPVGPPRELIDIAPDLRDSPPVRLEPVAQPVQLPAVEDVTAAHAPTIEEFGEDPVAAGLRQSRVVSVLASATPHEVGRLVASRPDALTLTDDPAMASSVGYPVVADEEGRISVILPSSSSWEDGAMVEATDLSKTGLPDAGWKFTNGQGPVRFKLEGKTLLVDQEATALSGAKRMQEMMQANARESFAGPDIADDPVRFLRNVQEVLDKGPLKKIPAGNMLENIERYIQAHEGKAPTMELAGQLALPGSKPHQVGKELARALQDWALIGSMLENAKNVARVSTAMELPNPERFPTAVSVRNGETPEGAVSPTVSMGLEGPRSPAEWFQQVYTNGVEVPGPEGLGVYDFSVGAPNDAYKQFGFKPRVRKGVPEKLLRGLAESESGGRVLRVLKAGIEGLMEAIPPSLTSIALGHPGAESAVNWEETEVDGWMLRPSVFAHNVTQVGRPAPRRGRGIQFNPVMMVQANIEMMNDSLGYLVEEGLEIPVKVSSGEVVRLTADKGSAGYQEVLKHLMVDTFVVTSVHEVAHSPMDTVFSRHDVEHDRMMELVAEVGEGPLAQMRAALMKELEDGKFVREIHELAGRLTPTGLGLTASGGSVPILPETISLQPGQGRAARGTRVGDRPLEVPQVSGPRGTEARIRGAGLRGGLEASEVIAPASRLPYGLHPSGFYARLRRLVESGEQQRWKPDGLKEWLRSAGLEAAEQRWLGVDHLVKGRVEVVEREELLGLLAENEVALEEMAGEDNERAVVLRLDGEMVGQAQFEDRFDTDGRTLVVSKVEGPEPRDEMAEFKAWAEAKEGAGLGEKEGGFYWNMWKLGGGGVPAVPFEGRLHEVVAKKALRYAAENRYGRLEWGGAGDVGGFLQEYAGTNRWKTDKEGMAVEQVARSLEGKGQPLGGLEDVAPAMAEGPTRRELALGHMETGQGWSRKKKLFQSLTPEERFRAMQIRLAGGDFGSTWDKGGKFSWKALNPRKWSNAGKYPKYFGEWVPAPEQMGALQKLWDARGVQLEKAGRLAGPPSMS